MPAEQPERGPGRNYEGNQQGEEHGRRSAHGNRPHIGSHQAADKGHGQYRRDHGEGGQNSGITHLGDRFDRDFTHRSAVVLRKPEVAHHVLDDNDGVIDENAYTKNQSEESYAIDGVAEEIEDGHGKRERDRNSQQHHTRLAPPQEERDQQGYGQGGEQQVLKQFIGLGFGG